MEVIPLVNDFDAIERARDDKKGNMSFEISKSISSTYYVITFQRGKKKLEVKTFWKKKIKK